MEVGSEMEERIADVVPHRVPYPLPGGGSEVATSLSDTADGNNQTLIEVFEIIEGITESADRLTQNTSELIEALPPETTSIVTDAVTHLSTMV